MNSNPKLNLTEEDKRTYVVNMYVDMILKKKHKELMKDVRKEARMLYKKFHKSLQV